MALFSITINEQTNKPPDQLGAVLKTISDGDTDYTITIQDVTTELVPPYRDPEDDPLMKIKILDINENNTGVFRLSGDPISVDQEILASEISTGEFIYTGSTEDSEYSDFIYFDAADTGSETFGGLSGLFQITVVPPVNLPPSIGDGEETINYGETLVFTKEMFVDNTHPSYTDPEGDAPYKLRIDSLPNLGLLIYENEPVEEGDEIEFTDIELGMFMYMPDLDATATEDVTFEFSISDVGSEEFSS